MKRSCLALALSLAALSACDAIDRMPFGVSAGGHGRARIVLDAPPAPLLTAAQLRAAMSDLRGTLTALDSPRSRPAMKRKAQAAERRHHEIPRDARADSAGFGRRENSWERLRPSPLPPVPIIDIEPAVFGLRGSVYGY